jgi:hypothetical protein
MALPVLGGLLISDEVVDLFLPVRFYWVRRRRWLKLHQEKQGSSGSVKVRRPATDRAGSSRAGTGLASRGPAETDNSASRY